MWKQQVLNYTPINEQEERDQQAMIACLQSFEDVLTRANVIAHMTCSGFVVNRARTKVLMVYHNIYNSWSWTGGHADGETDFLQVAIREVQEETGLSSTPVVDQIFALDMLTVIGHVKKGQWVTPHLHMNVTYLLEADEQEATTVAIEENSDVRWLPLDALATFVSEPDLLIVYEKIIEKMRTQQL